VRLFLNNLFALKPKVEPGPPFQPPEGFVWVPPGEFVLGGKDGFDIQIARLDEGVFSARAPVTNAEYALFVESDGYREPRYWTEEGWAQREKDGWTEPRFWDDERYNEPDRPVVGVSWYEATAYCNWLTVHWLVGAQHAAPLPTGYAVRLPTEHEWEKAARGVDGREYPWGDEWIEGRCNSSELGFGRTSPVGEFSPEGDSPYGLWDAAGNVWEWNLGQMGSARVLRGGSWFNNRRYARCASRSRDYPYYRLDDFGFRVVVSPVSPLSAL
jgi:formylglycine-generating enzyme required for sulfatase activity